MKDGTSVPYIPVEVKTARDAYAASLHALFKHVADFHLCIVRTFSVKYGIPEDDILKTIQESEEFKNMQVDPAICMDGHLAKTPDTSAIIEPVSNQKAKPVARMKQTKPIAPVVAPVVAPIMMTDEEHVTREPTAVTAIKTIRKKIVVPKSNAVNAANIDLLTEDNAIAANTNGTLMKQVLTDAPFVKTSQPSEPIKTIRKKVVQTPSAAPATNAVTHDAPRKIIKKTTCV